MMSLAVLLLIQAQVPRPIPYYDPAGRRPSTHEEFVAECGDRPFEGRVIGHTAADGRYDRLVLVFVNATLYPSIQPEFATYLADVAADGFTTKVVAVTGGRPQNLRQILQAHRDSGLVGGVMVGDLPVAWWSDGSAGEDFPIDLFFGDLDGIFSDANGDGKYDTHSGNTAPDIWIGRICASRMTYDCEEHLVKSYFSRNHEYRNGQLMIPRRGLVYNEVDWYPNNHGMSGLYTDITMFNDANTTTAYHYKNQLQQGYEFVHLISHSSPWVHTFFLAGDVPGGGSVFNFEIPALAPNAAFYFLNACMCGRFTERDNLGNWYLFAQPWGQVVMASSQLMYGLSDLSTVYSALGHDSCFGGAFLAWHRSNYPSFMGTLMLGDPTLKVRRTPPLVARLNPPCYQASAPQDWTEYAVENSNFVNGRPRIGQSQGQIRIVFDSGRNVRSDNYMTSFNGTQFTPPESIAWHDYYDLFSSCATDVTGRFWVVWQSFRDYDVGYDHFQLLSTYYYNGTWSPIQRVGPAAGYHDVQAAVACGTDNTVWCAFKSWRNGQGDIWVSSEQNGGSWAAPTRLTTDSLDQFDPCITVDHGNRPWVFWTSMANGRRRLQGRTYNNGWQPAFDLDTAGSNGPPRATVDGEGRVWVIYHKWLGGQLDIYHCSRSDSTWSQPQVLTSTPADDVLPDIAPAPDGSVWACWQSRQAGPWDIYTARYRDGWTEPQPLTNDNADDYDPTIGVDASGNVWTAWASDRRGYWNIYAARSPLTGVSAFPAAKPVTFTVSPNPFSRQVFFRGPERFSVGIYAVDGRKVAQTEGRNGAAAWIPGDVPRGIYLARVAVPGRCTVIKLTCAE
jgi:hypothetical protein